MTSHTGKVKLFVCFQERSDKLLLCLWLLCECLEHLFQELEINVQLSVPAKVGFMCEFKISIQDREDT